MASIWKRKADKGKKGSRYLIAYVNHLGERVTVKGFSDKTATEQLAAHLEKEAELRRRGFFDPKADVYAKAEQESLLVHLADWRKYLIDSGDSEKHADLVHGRAARAIALISGGKLSEIVAPSASKVRRIEATKNLEKILKGSRLSVLSPDKAAAALALLSGDGRSIQTVNHYVAALKNFSNWLAITAGRTRGNLLAALENYGNPETDRRHERRALSPSEASELIQAAEVGPEAEGMTGLDRAMVYRIAFATGFRAKELRKLVPLSFRLDNEPPEIVTAAKDSKNTKEAAQPIAEPLAALLRPWLASKPPNRPVFNLPAVHTARMIRADLKAAGIPVQDEHGRTVDFHATRVTFVSDLTQAKVTVQTLKTLARHASATTTLKHYAKLGRYDLTEAVAALPNHAAVHQNEADNHLNATGTDGKSAAPALRSGYGSRRTLAFSGGTGSADSSAQEKAPAAFMRSGAGSGLEAPTRFELVNNGFANRSKTSENVEKSRAFRLIGPLGAAPALRAGNSRPELPPDLVEVVSAWPDLPEAVRAGILAMVRASRS